MIDESDKSLFRSTVNEQMPIDKDADNKESYNHKQHWKKSFEDYSFLPKTSESVKISFTIIKFIESFVCIGSVKHFLHSVIEFA